jgi:hypothetical protein
LKIFKGVNKKCDNDLRDRKQIGKMSKRKSVGSMLEELYIYLHLYQSSLPNIYNEITLNTAEDKMIDEVEDFISKICDKNTETHDNLMLYASAILKGWRMAMEKIMNINQIQFKSSNTVISEEDRIHLWIKELQEHTQVAQRTENWYIQGSKLLTGSEIYTLFGSPYQRGQLVLAKANPQPKFQNKLVCRTKYMTPFDWGIRFEPVVFQIYENITKCKLGELGRIVGKNDPRVAASPDAIVIEGERLGRLVEMKAPVSRKINGDIPPEYYAQMQTQMEVTGAQLCDYIEVKFDAPYKVDCGINGPAEIVFPLINKFYGVIYIMAEDDDNRDPEDMFWEPQLSYYYPPLFQKDDNNLGKYRVEQIVERIPWVSNLHSLKTVHKSDEWWAEMQKHVDAFWMDVELAREGKFVAPPSSRAPKMSVNAKMQLTLDKFIEEVVDVPIDKMM